MESEKLKILLVEDDAINYRRVQRFLETEGYEVLQLEGVRYIDSYEAAIEMCNQVVPHMAILDISIKGEKDGIDIGAYIRSKYKSPIIFLSAYNNDVNMDRITSINADGFVSKRVKPVPLDQLRTDLKRLKAVALEAARIRKEGGWFYLYDLDTEVGFQHLKIKWKDVHSLTTRLAPANNIFIKMQDGKRYRYNKSLNEFHQDLPDFILRYSGSDSINAHLFNRRGKGEWKYYIDDTPYEVSTTYRTEKARAMLRKLHF